MGDNHAPGAAYSAFLPPVILFYCRHQFRLGLSDKSAAKVDSADPEYLTKCY